MNIILLSMRDVRVIILLPFKIWIQQPLSKYFISFEIKLLKIVTGRNLISHWRFKKNKLRLISSIYKKIKKLNNFSFVILPHTFLLNY